MRKSGVENYADTLAMLSEPDRKFIEDFFLGLSENEDVAPAPDLIDRMMSTIATLPVENQFILVAIAFKRCMPLVCTAQVGKWARGNSSWLAAQLRSDGRLPDTYIPRS